MRLEYVKNLLSSGELGHGGDSLVRRVYGHLG